MSNLLSKLQGGDRRSIGRVDEVMADVQANPALFGELFQGMLAEDEVVRMRAADAAEKLTVDHPEWLQGYKAVFIEEILAVQQQEVRWHWAQMAPRLALDEQERQMVFEILTGFLKDRSSIVKTFTLQALVDLSRKYPELMPRVRPLVEEAVASGTPAMKSRGRKLLQEMGWGSDRSDSV